MTRELGAKNYVENGHKSDQNGHTENPKRPQPHDMVIISANKNVNK